LALGSISLLDSSIAFFEVNGIQPGNQTQIDLSMGSQGFLEQQFIHAQSLKDEEVSLLNIRQEEANRNLQNTQVFIIVSSLFVFGVLGMSLFISTNLVRNKNSAERLLKKSYDELEDKVEERTTELKSSNENLVNEIGSRIKIEKSLRESEERFRQMADSAPVLIWMTDKDKRGIYYNKVWLDYTGLTKEQQLSANWSENIHPSDLKMCEDIFNDSYGKREEFEMEYRLKTSLGDYRWVLNRGIPRYEGNEFIGYIGSCIDIHSKKRTERYLRIQYSVSKSLTDSKNVNEAFKRIIENICTELEWDFGMVWLIEGDKLRQSSLWAENIKVVEEYSELFGVNFTFEKGLGLPGRVWKNNRSTWIQDIEADNNLPRKRGLLQLGLKSGLGFPIVGNDIIGVIECFNKTELTPKEDLLQILETVGRQIGSYIERKRVEEQLKDSHDELESRVKDRTIELANTLNKLLSEIEQKEQIQNKLKLFGHAIRGIKECVYITDLNNNTLFVNAAFEEIYGYYEEELLGKQIPALYSNVSEELRDEILMQSLRTGWRGEIRNKRRDGKEIDIYLSTSAVRNEEGKVQALVGICQDITESIEQKELLVKRNGLLRLLNDVSIVTNRSFNVEASVSYAINKMCEYTDWDIGHCYFVEGDKLVSSNIWNANLSSKFLELKKLTESVTYEKGEGMPGRVLENNESYWTKIKEFDDVSKYKRSDIAKKVGIKTGVWAPIKKGNEVIGVLEFYNKDEKEKDIEVLDSINNIGVELGSLFERNEFVELIKEREKHFKAVADTANEAIITVNNKGKIIYANQSVEDIFGFTIDELINEELTLLMPDDLKNRHLKAFSRVVETGQSLLLGETVELRGKRKDGKEFPIELSLARWELNDEAYFTGMIRDISLRKQIERELIDSRNSLLEAQSFAKMGSWEWDVQSDTVKWSDEMYSIYEISYDEFTPSFEGFISLLHPENRDEVKSKIEYSYGSKTPFDFYEKILIPGGRTKILRSKGGVKTDEKGTVTKLVGTCLDVTEVHEAEQKIRESEENLRLLIENVKDYAIIRLDLKGNIISWNKGAETIKGYTADEIIGKHFSIFYTEDEKNENEPAFNLEMAKRLSRYEKEGWRTRKDGSLFWADVIFSVLNDDEGKPVGFVKVTRDITERKKAEEAIIESEKQLKEAQKIAKIGSWDWEVSTDKVRWSEEMYNIFEIEPGTPMTNEKYLALIDNENKRARDEAIAIALKENIPFNYYLKIQSKSGKTKILNSMGEIEPDDKGNIRRMVGTIIDVTEIKEAEESIRKSEKQLKDAQQIAGLGSWEIDMKTNDIKWSDEMYRIFNIDKSEKPKTYEYIRGLIHPEDVESVDKILKKLEARPEEAVLDYRIVTSDGVLKYINTDIRVEFDENSKPARIYGSVQDLTDIKLVEEELRRTNARLIEAQKELVHNEKLAALGRFSSGIAHEIRNPLANISALAQLLSKAKIDDEKMKKHLKYILINADIANNIIKDLLHFASPEDLVFKEENLNTVLDTIVNSIEPRCTESKVLVSKNIRIVPGEIYVDKTRLENALLNFMSNSIDAMPEGGNLSVSAKTNKLNNEVIIDVIDTGQGIPQENLDKIFEPFFTTKETGTGLGLGLAYQTIKLHQGILNISSEPGKGTHVEIKLPIRKNINGKNINN
jgi:PAS domain S-box-containing protein